MGKFVNPFTDIGFKIIFGQPASKPFLITLLNELLAGEHRIEDLVFLDKEDHAEHDYLRPLLPYLHGRIYHRGDAEPQASEFRGPNIILYVSCGEPSD